MAYVVFTFFLLISGWFFSQIFLFYSDASMRSFMQPQMGQTLSVTDNVMRPLFTNMSVVLLFFVPMLTMRLFAEEKKSGTIELLLTYPVRDGEVLIGKYLAALMLFAILLTLTLVYPAIVARFARVEWGPIASGYLGLLLAGAMFLAIGVLVSSLTENQIVAGFGTFGILLALLDHRVGRRVGRGNLRVGAAIPVHPRPHGRLQPRRDRHQGPRVLRDRDRAGAVPHAPVARVQAVERVVP